MYEWRYGWMKGGKGSYYSCAGIGGSQKRVLDPAELGFQTV